MADEPPLAVHKASYLMPVEVDTDGTPLIDGDRCVEVEPGQWMHPTGAALYAALVLDTDSDGVILEPGPDTYSE